jgi:hypothetical protein
MHERAVLTSPGTATPINPSSSFGDRLDPNVPDESARANDPRRTRTVLRRRCDDRPGRALSLALVAIMLAGSFVALSSVTAGSATAASRTLASSVATNGEWPGVG